MSNIEAPLEGDCTDMTDAELLADAQREYDEWVAERDA